MGSAPDHPFDASMDDTHQRPLSHSLSSSYESIDSGPYLTPKRWSDLEFSVYEFNHKDKRLLPSFDESKVRQLDSGMISGNEDDESQDENENENGDEDSSHGKPTKRIKVTSKAYPITKWDKALFLFPPSSKLRISCLKTTKHFAFDTFILLNILVNCVFLAMNDPTGQYEQKWLDEADYYFTAVFTVEMIIRIIATGFIFNNSPPVNKWFGVAYLRDPFCWIDLIVVVSAYPSMFVDGASLGALRALRALRPLKAIRSVPTLRYVMQTIFRAAPMFLDIVIQAIFIIYLFAVLAVMLFMGVLRKNCTDGTSLYVDPDNPDGILCGYTKCPVDAYTCQPLECSRELDNGQSFPNPNYGFTSFDNILYAMLNLFQCITQEGWTDIAYGVMDTTTTWSVIYFIIVVFIGSFLITNLAIAVITDSYTDAAEEENDDTNSKKSAVSQARSVVSTSMRSDRSIINRFWSKVTTGCKRCSAGMVTRTLWLIPSRKWVSYYIVSTLWFEFTVLGAVVANTAILAATYAFMPESLTNAFDICNYVFTGIFAMEATLRIFSYGPKKYFSSGANCLDFVIVLLSIIEVCIPSDFSGMSVFRALRLLRLLKLIKSSEKIQKLVAKMQKSFVSILKFSPVLLLTLFVFSVMGMSFFGPAFKSDTGSVCVPSSTEEEGCPRANWSNFPNAILTVFIVLTADNWPAIMWDGMRFTNPAAALYFILMFVVLTFIMLNMFLTIVLFDFSLDDDNEPEKSADGLDMEAKNGIIQEAKEEAHRCVDCWTCKPPRISWKSDHGDVGSDSCSVGNDGDDDDDFVSFSSNDEAKLEMVNGMIMIPNEKYDNVGKSGALSPLGVILKSSPRSDSLGGPAGVNDDAPRKQVSFFRESAEESAANAAVPSALSREALDALDTEDDPAKSGAEDANGETMDSKSQQSTGSGSLAPGATLECHIPLFFMEPYREYSLFVFSEQNIIRRILLVVVNHQWFEYFMLVIILWSCICLAIYSPLQDPNGTTAKALDIMDYIFVSIFTLEWLMKIVAWGFFLNEGSYCRDLWNDLDFFIVLCGLVDVAASGADLAYLRALRALRVLRVLRVVKRLQGLKLIVRALVLALIPCFHVVIVGGALWLIFAILGVQLFAGKFYSCQCPTEELISNCTRTTPLMTDSYTMNWLAAESMPGSMSRQQPVVCDPSLITGNTAPQQCAAMGGQWVNFPSNFDNTGIALLTLFEIASLSGWSQIMYQGMDAVEVNEEPIQNKNFWAWLYFAVFVFVGSFFVLSVIVSVIVDTFSTIKSKAEGTALLTPEQREWMEEVRMMFQLQLEPTPLAPKPDSFFVSLRMFCFRIVVQPWFEFFIIVVILLNTVILGMEFYDANKAWQEFYLIAGSICTWIFIVEAILKLVGLGPKQYFRSKWNIFDFTICVLSFVTFVFDMLEVTSDFESPFDATVLRVFRIFRLLRVLRLTKKFKNLRVLFETLYLCLPSLFNVGSLMFLVFFFYAVLGVEFFGTVEPLENPPENGGGISEFNNFTTFYWALLLLLAAMTGNGWNAVMNDLCSLGGLYYLSIVYFVTFIILAAYIVLNLFIAVVLEAFATVMKRDEFRISEMDLELYAQAWSHFDPDATRKINIARDLKPLLMELDPPLGLGPDAKTREVLQFVDDLDLPGTDGMVTFHDLLYALARRSYSTEVDHIKKSSRKKFGVPVSETVSSTKSLIKGRRTKRTSSGNEGGEEIGSTADLQSMGDSGNALSLPNSQDQLVIAPEGKRNMGHVNMAAAALQRAARKYLDELDELDELGKGEQSSPSVDRDSGKQEEAGSVPLSGVVSTPPQEEAAGPRRPSNFLDPINDPERFLREVATSPESGIVDEPLMGSAPMDARYYMRMRRTRSKK